MKLETTAAGVTGWLLFIVALYLFYTGETVEGLVMIVIGKLYFISADINEYIKGS